MTAAPPPEDLPTAVRTSWHCFADTYEPLRSELYRYCRHLTRSPWDAEEHRGRGKLLEPEAEMPRVPARGALDAFCDAFNARDLERIKALLLDSATVEIVGASTSFVPGAGRAQMLFGMMFGSERLAQADTRGGVEARFMQGVLPVPPRAELRLHRGEPIVLFWYAHQDAEAVRALNRIETQGDKISLVANYFFTPDLIAEVCAELGVPARSNGHRWWLSNRTEEKC